MHKVDTPNKVENVNLKLFFGKDVYNFIIYSRITLYNPGRDYEKWERYLSLKLLFETRKLTCALNSSSHLFMGQQQLERVPYPVGFRLHLIRTVNLRIFYSLASKQSPFLQSGQISSVDGLVQPHGQEQGIITNPLWFSRYLFLFYLHLINC